VPTPDCWAFHEGGIRTGIDGEEQSATHLGELLIQILPADARLDDDVHVVLVELDNLVHVGKVDAYAAERGREVPLEARAARVRDDWHAVLVADLGDSRHLLG
jgi:hypothetical protein